MAIRMMTKADEAHLPNVQTVHNFHGHESNRWRHCYDCPHYHTDNQFRSEGLPGCLPQCKCGEPLYMKTTHVGLVLYKGERNYYDDSNFYAIVWNPEKGEPETIEYATTRGWTYPNSAVVDAPPEIVAAYQEHERRIAEEHAAIKAAEEAITPRVGKVVRIVKGRKIPIGTTGRVFWAGADRFKSHRYDNPNRWMLASVMVLDAPERVGIETDGGEKFFTAASNVAVLTDVEAAQ